jgi:hypothetical protein
MKTCNKKLVGAVVTFGLLIVFINTFYFWFINDEFSRDSSDWGAFGDYISGISSFFNLVFFVYISFWLYKWGKKDSVDEQIRESITKCMESLSETRFYILELNKGLLDKSEVSKIIKESLLKLYINNTVLNSKIEISEHKFDTENLKESLKKLIRLNDNNIKTLEKSDSLQNNYEILLAEVTTINNGYIECLRLVK